MNWGPIPRSAAAAERLVAYLEEQIPPAPPGLTERVVRRVAQERRGVSPSSDGGSADGGAGGAMERFLAYLKGQIPPVPSGLPEHVRARARSASNCSWTIWRPVPRCYDDDDQDGFPVTQPMPHLPRRRRLPHEVWGRDSPPPD
jgi:hypothetical protein